MPCIQEFVSFHSVVSCSDISSSGTSQVLSENGVDGCGYRRFVVSDSAARIALVFRGDRGMPDARAQHPRLGPVFDALAAEGLAPEAVVFSEDAIAEVRDRLHRVDGVLVWVDPVTGDADRMQLDAMLREVAAVGVWISAHPDVIMQMGTKEVLYRTRELGWGSETYRYRTVGELEQELPARLAGGGARVLKQLRGNGGIGVQKVELVTPGVATRDAVVRVQYARTRDEGTEDLALGELMSRCAKYFTYSGGAGCLIDQPFQPRISEGIIRSYLVKGEVVGFARQYPESGSDRVFGLPSQKTMFRPDEPAFDRLRAKLECEWVPAMQTLVDVDPDALPALWDADFLFGPKDDAGDDTYVLCEINVSSVLPFPPEAPPRLARAVRAALLSRRPC
jgi:hypothetical protein